MIKINGLNKKNIFLKTIRQNQKHFSNTSNKSIEFYTSQNQTIRNFNILNPTIEWVKCQICLPKR